MCASALHGQAGTYRHHENIHPRAGPEPEGCGPDQRPVCHQERCRLRAGSKPARLPGRSPSSPRPSVCRSPGSRRGSWSGSPCGSRVLLKRSSRPMLRSKRWCCLSSNSRDRTACSDPEMKSTGEVMGIYEEPGIAFAKGQSAAGGSLPLSGAVLISVNAFDHENAIDIARALVGQGFTIMATSGTGKDAAGRRSPGRPGQQDLGGHAAYRGPHPPERYSTHHQYPPGQECAG